MSDKSVGKNIKIVNDNGSENMNKAEKYLKSIEVSDLSLPQYWTHPRLLCKRPPPKKSRCGNGSYVGIYAVATEVSEWNGYANAPLLQAFVGGGTFQRECAPKGATTITSL